MEIGSIPQEGVEHSAEPVGHGDDRAFVATPGTELQKIRMQRMRGTPGVMRGLAEHRAELGRSTLGDMAVTIAVRGLVGARDQARVTRDVLGTAEALDVGEDCDGGERDETPLESNSVEYR